MRGWVEVPRLSCRHPRGGANLIRYNRFLAQVVNCALWCVDRIDKRHLSM